MKKKTLFIIVYIGMFAAFLFGNLSIMSSGADTLGEIVWWGILSIEISIFFISLLLVRIINKLEKNDKKENEKEIDIKKKK